MSNEKQAVDSFLRQYRMHYEDMNVSSVVDTFLSEMGRGLAGQESSLAMIPTFIEADRPIVRGKSVAVLDAGGTHLRRALVSFGADGKPVVQEYNKSPMPGTQGEVGAQEFFETLGREVAAVLGQSDCIGFCFSYPTEIFPDRDGRLLRFTKEVQAPEVEGQVIGQNLRSALKSLGVPGKRRVVILNDTVATLLTGKASCPDKDYGGYVGFILGTGTNICYLESNRAIGKVSGLDPAQSQVINVESGGFDKAPRGEADEALDKKSQAPGVHLLEKMVSGGYFGPLAYEVVKLALDNGLFSGPARESLAGLRELTTIEANAFLHNPADRNSPLSTKLQAGTEADRERMFFLLDGLLQRAARLTAANVAAAVVKSGHGQSPLQPVCLTIDGTTFYAYYRFRFQVEKHLEEYLGPRGYHFEIVRVEEAPLIGAAIAGLTN